MHTAYNIKTFIYAIFLDAASLLYILQVWLYKYLPNSLVDALGDSHLQNAFKGGSAIVIFALLFIARCYDVASRKRKFNLDVADKSYFDAYVIAGNTLKEEKRYEAALEIYQKALELNYDNENAMAKINNVKHLIEVGE